MKQEVNKQVERGGIRELQWSRKYNMVWKFVEQNHRGPSRHRIEEHNMLNWMKFNRKMLKVDKLQGEKREKFQKLVDLIHSFHRVNQYA